jgi:hypothetical protein
MLVVSISICSAVASKCVSLPDPHQSDISVALLKRILEEADVSLVSLSGMGTIVVFQFFPKA